MVLLKFVPKDQASGVLEVSFNPESCRACIQLHDPAYERFNAREAVLQFEVPKNRSLELRFKIVPDTVKRVIINDSDMEVHQEGDVLIVPLPPLDADAVLAPIFATDIVETGLVVRVEHGDVVRRAGAYATGDFPVAMRRAADNLSFAQREVARRLGLGDYVEAEKIGRIMILGFDTNYPAGHTDAPPHFHMHMRWPNNVGSQISHYYFDEDCLLDRNMVDVRAMNAPLRYYERGEAFWTVDNQGRKVYGHTITDKGYLKIESPLSGACLLSPTGKGFDAGVEIDCGEKGQTSVMVEDDIEAGIMKVQTGSIEEVFRYDTDTGTLLSPSTAPPLPYSARNPEF